MFDARDIQKLAPGEHITTEECPGLRVQATASRRTWIYRYRSPVDGKLRQIKLGNFPAMTIRKAEAAWELARDKRDAGEDPALEKKAVRKIAQEAQKKKASGRVTVGDVADDYLKRHLTVNRNEKGRKEIARMFQKMLGDDASAEVETYTRKQAHALISRWAHAPVQAIKLRAELAAAWEKAADSALIPEDTPNWWKRILKGDLKSKGKKILGEHVGQGKRVLKNTEVGALVKWLPNFSRVVEDVLTIYLWTGCRGGEIVSMHSREISEEADGMWWTIPKHKTKNARHDKAGDLRVPLIGRAASIVNRRRELLPSGYLFPSTTKEGYTQQKTIQTAVFYHQPYSKTRPTDLRPRLTVTHWAPHDLRRTVRTALSAMNCPAPVAEAVLGHMAPGVVGVYDLHSYDQERRIWLTRIAQRWEEIVAAS